MNTPIVSKKGMFSKAATTVKEDAAPIRPPMREDDPKARAAQRAAQLREHSNNEIVDGIVAAVIHKLINEFFTAYI